MKYLLLALLISSCAVVDEQITPKGIEVTDSGQTNYGFPLYNVTFPDGKVIELLYEEEVKHGLATGNWTANEDLQLFKSNPK